MKRKYHYLYIAAICLCLPLTRGIADILELRNGVKVEGAFLGASEDSIKFQTSIGVTTVLTSEVATLHFAAPAPAPVPAPAPMPAGPVTVPAGSVLIVQMKTTVSSNSRPGTKYSAVLQSDLSAGGKVVARAGTQVFGLVTNAVKPGRLAGRPVLELALTELNINGKLVPIVTTSFSDTGKSSFAKAARGATAGAIIGGVASDDAGSGAAIGATVGVLKRSDSVTVPVNSILEFRLAQPLYYQ